MSNKDMKLMFSDALQFNLASLTLQLWLLHRHIYQMLNLKQFWVWPKRHFMDNPSGNKICRKESWISSKLVHTATMILFWLIRLHNLFYRLLAFFMSVISGFFITSSHCMKGLALIFVEHACLYVGRVE